MTYDRRYLSMTQFKLHEGGAGAKDIMVWSRRRQQICGICVKGTITLGQSQDEGQTPGPYSNYVVKLNNLNLQDSFTSAEPQI